MYENVNGDGVFDKHYTNRVMALLAFIVIIVMYVEGNADAVVEEYSNRVWRQRLSGKPGTIKLPGGRGGPHSGHW